MKIDSLLDIKDYLNVNKTIRVINNVIIRGKTAMEDEGVVIIHS